MSSQKQLEFELVLNKRFSALEKKLNDLLNDKSKGIYHALEELDKYVKKNTKKKTFDAEKFKIDIWTETSKQWSDVLSKQINEVYATELTKILSDVKYGTGDFIGF